ncbi:FAD-dependent oxidoreductase [Devosia sp.]|uniref:FAD-dependent oxidoreductase n=1 Tax=Devosia sp. TaxID=1871048 RepID=UPI002626B1D1|nr:FAD-dependent oxidoreductase [Devosia sp.]
MAEAIRPDLCIVGAGALGVALARHARHRGLEVTLVDRGRAEPGDIQAHATKLAGLAASAAHAQALRRNGHFGIGPETPKVAMKAIQERLDHLVGQMEPETSRDRLAALGIGVVAGASRFVDASGLKVGDDVVRPRRFILAVGGHPALPDVPGLDEIAVFDPASLLDNSRKLTHLLVIGGDESAVCLAQAYRRLGTAVSLVPQGALLADYDPEAVAMLVRHLSDEEVTVLDGAMVQEIQPRRQGTGIVLAMPNGDADTLDVSHVLVSTGRVADVSDLDLVAAKLTMEPDGSLQVRAGGRSSNRLVRLAGIAAGIGQWGEALAQGQAIVDAVAGVAAKRQGFVPPKLVPTDPPLVQIGRSALLRGKSPARIQVLRASLSENLAALAAGVDLGLLKVLVGGDDKIVGGAAFGFGAAETAAVLAFAMENGVDFSRLADPAVPAPGALVALSDLARRHAAARPESPWASRRRAARRLLPW